MISDKTVDKLNALPLPEVMRNNGYLPASQTARSVFYRCPFHDEKNGSFCVSKFPPKGERYAAFNCFVCGEQNRSKGVGAIMLQQRLLERAGEKHDFPDAVNRLAKDFNLIIEGDYKNGFFHRARKTAPQPEVDFRIRKGEFTPAELRALGCQVLPVFRTGKNTSEGTEQTAVTDADGNNLLRCSFNPDFYRGNTLAPFDSTQLRTMFNLYPLESYVTPEKADADGVLTSYEVKSTPSYPIFLFRYEDENGWWARKYEPYFRETTDADGRRQPNYKFTWWYQGGSRPEGFYKEIYGDADVMRALQTGRVETSDKEGHPIINIEKTRVDEQRRRTRAFADVFRRIVICSGPRDAINVYFHSDAHVVFPHSESVEISSETIRRLLDISMEVFVLYDIDRTGIRAMNRLALKHVELKVLYLPEDLSTQYNPRSGKACKDAEEFFNFYPAVMRRNEKLMHTNVNRYFDDLLKTARRMRFWDVQYQTKKQEDESKVVVRKYTLNFDNMAQFLSANGFYKYTDEADTTKFVHISNNIVDVVEESQALSEAKEIMKDFLIYNSQYYSEELSNAISTQKKIGRDTMSGIKKVDLNFMSWGKDFDYFFFRNCAVKVTADSIEPVDYVDLPFHVNRKAIIDADYHPLKSPLFTIEENPEYAARKELNDQRMADKRMNENERRREDAEFIAYQRLYRFLLKMPKDIDQMPVCVQWLYDTSRIHWRKEAEGYPLTELEKQRQDMHFICKVALMGYMLSRYRTGTMQKMGVVTEYTVADEGKNSGGTGKSFFRSFFELVRKVCYIPGQTLKKKENMAKNFDKFHYTVDSMCLIDDLRPDMMGSEFYNITDNITVKTLYHDEMTLPREATPKIFITMNKMPFDMTEGSTSRRIFLAMQSDYYHDEDYAGQFKKRTPQTKFGKDIFLEATEEERDEAVYMMLQSCQFYLGLQESLIPPMSQDGQMRILYSAIKDQVFIDWANHFFANQWHWCRPVSISEMAISYLEHRGDVVTLQSVKSVKNEMIEKMQAYCFNMQYTMNPSIVYRSDKGSKYPRHYAWEQEFMNDTIRREERTRKSTRVCFFYKLGEEPKDSKEILSCPETDEEWEEKKRFEDD